MTLLEAVILILKYATFLLLSSPSKESALTCVDQHYREANIDLKIQEYLKTSQHHIPEYVDFIMATKIGLFILTSIKCIFHPVCVESMHPDI